MRIARLDGIRALAVLLVFATHTLYFALGWTGVSLFFVLSGYLITTILRRDREKPHYWGPFYIKRATRILPALILLFVMAIPIAATKWRLMWPYYLLFATNIGEARHPFAGVELSILWSLAVEEHFYLIWPFAVRYLNRTTLIRLLLVVLAVEPVLRGLFAHRFNTYWVIYVLTPFQLDGLVAGSLLAVLLEDPKWTPRLLRISGPVALLSCLVFCGASFFHSFQVRSNTLIFNVLGYSLVTLVSVAFLAYTLLREEALTSRILSNSVVAWIGLISYGVYLYHVIVVRATQLVLWRVHFDHMRTLEPVIIAVTLLLGASSYYYYERPIMRWGGRQAKLLESRDLVVR